MSTVPNATTGIDSNAGLQSTVEDPNLAASQTTDEGTPTGDQTAELKAGEQTPETSPEGEQVEQTREDGRVIPQWMKALQQTNPEAYKKAKADLFEMRDRRSVHPTIQAAREEHDLVESLGGAEGATALREDANFFKEAANTFLKGDPAFVKDLWEEDAIAAALHVQPMLDAFKTHDIEGYKSTIARVWDNEFQQVGFEDRGLTPLEAAIKAGNKEEALSILSSIRNWKDSISGVARKADDPRVKTLLAERARQHDTRQQQENAEFLKGYRTEAINTVVADGEAAFNSFFKNRKLDAEDRQDLLRETVAIANRAVMADKSFTEQRDRHLASGDSKAAIRLTKARYAREFPLAAKRVARRYGIASGTSTTATQQRISTTNNGQQKPNAAQGFTAVQERPDQMDIDRSRTSSEMIFAKRAILKDGRKVDWSVWAAKEAAAR